MIFQFSLKCPLPSKKAGDPAVVNYFIKSENMRHINQYLTVRVKYKRIAESDVIKTQKACASGLLNLLPVLSVT